MKRFKEWVEDNDNLIIDEVCNIALSHGFAVEFMGYYIEGNEYSINAGPRPFWKSMEEYHKDNPYSIMEHVRYFFDCKQGSLQFTITVHVSQTKLDGFGLNLVVEHRNFDALKNSEEFGVADLEPLHELVKKRLKDESRD